MARTRAKRKFLTQGQALIVKEMLVLPDAFTAWPVLADAAGLECNRLGHVQVHSMVQDIRGKFGADCILTGPTGGYKLNVEALDR